MKLYHYVTKGNNVLEKGLFSFAKSPNVDLNYYKKRSGQKTKKGIIQWMESCFQGRSRGIRFFTTPLQWTDKSLRLKELVDTCDLFEIDIEALNQDGYIEKVFFKPSLFDKKYPVPKGFDLRDEYLVPLKSIKDIDFKYKQTWSKCDDNKGLRMAPLRFHVLVIKGGIIPPKYIKKVEEIQIRNVRLSDAKRLAEINILCWQKNYRGLIQDDYLNQMSITQKRIDHKRELILKSRQTKDPYFCAVKNGQVVGYLQGKKKTKEAPAPYVVLYFYIHPDFQHQGIGTLLLEHFQQKIKNKSFYLYMLKGNTQAQKFYQNMGGILQSKNMDIEQTVYNFIIHEVCWLFNPKE